MSNKSKSTYVKDNKHISNDFFNIPLIGVVQRTDHDTHSGDYDLGELISNFPSKNNKHITLQVLDNAMIKAGIIKGDFINIDINAKLKNGDLVVIQLGERTYIRKYYSEENLIRLETADQYHTPIVIDPKTPGFKIIGKVISITRQL